MGTLGYKPWRISTAWTCVFRRTSGRASRAAGWGRRRAAPRFSRHGLASGWWGAVSKYLLLHLTCFQRNHGDAQQQAACAALHARAQTVPPSFDMDSEHEALWRYRRSDIRSITHPVLWGMYREATDRTHNLRAKAISETRTGIDDWVRQHAEKGNKRLHAWVRGDTPSSVEFQVDGSTTSDTALILASKRQFWADFWAPGENGLNNLRALQSLRDAAEKRSPCWIQLSVHHVAMQARDTTCWERSSAAQWRKPLLSTGWDAALSMVDLEKFYDTIRTVAHSAHRLHGVSGAEGHSIPWSFFAMAQPRGQHCSGISKLKQLGPHSSL